MREKGNYNAFDVYSQSKFANILFTNGEKSHSARRHLSARLFLNLRFFVGSLTPLELNRRLEGTGVTVNSLHPGSFALFISISPFHTVLSLKSFILYPNMMCIAFLSTALMPRRGPH
jgi:hypothetical protein